MSAGVYVGVNGKAQKVSNIYVGVDGKARRVLKGYVGVNGIARKIFEAPPDSVWTIVDRAPSFSSVGLAFGNQKFVTVEERKPSGGDTTSISQKFYYSAEGVDWTERNVTVQRNFYLGPVLYCGDKFFVPVLTEFTTASGGQDGKGFYYSTDGINWSYIETPKPNIHRIAYGQGKYVTFCIDGSNWYPAYSSDGTTWTLGTNAVVESPSFVAYGNGKFVYIASKSNYIYYSSDGLNWSATASLPYEITFSDLSYVGNKFIATGSYKIGNTYPDILITSSDGINWTIIEPAVRGFWNGSAYGNGKYVVNGGNTYQMLYSTDAAQWTDIPIPGYTARALAYGNGRFVSFRSGNKVAYWDGNI